MLIEENKNLKSIRERFDWNLGYLVLKDIFVHEILRIMIKRETTEIETMGVYPENASIYLRYNPEFVGSLTNPQLRYVLTHEVYHIVLHHCTKRKPTDPREKKMHNIAADLAVNSLITEDTSRHRPKCGMFPEDFGFEKKLSMEQYLQLLRDQQEDDDSDIEYGDGDGDSFDGHDGWAESSIASEIIRNKIAQISRKKGAWGNTPGDIQAMILAAQTSQIPWIRYLKHSIGQLICPQFESTFKKPNRRFGYPYSGKKRKHVDKKLVGIDTSLSVLDYNLAQFLAEINKLQELHPVDLVLFDHKIQLGPINYARKHVSFDFKGRGGTCFQPVFDIAEKGKYSSVIMLTDGEAPAPTKPACVKNVIWVITEYGRKPTEWGSYVQIVSKEK
jgi:predicted metal-dependent peptidase